MIRGSEHPAWFREPRVYAAAALCLLAFFGNKIVTWTIDALGASELHRQTSFVLHVLGTVAFVYGAMLIFEAYSASRRAREEAERSDRSLEP